MPFTGTSACYLDPGTENATEPYDGVYVNCLNENAPGGLDESGGDGGDGSPNYWWLPDPGPGASCPPGEAQCFKEEYGTPDYCINNDTPEGIGIDVFDDWADGHYPSGAEDVIRAKCSEKCQGTNQTNNLEPVCEDENWTAVVTKSFWEPEDGYNCLTSTNTNLVDPDGSNIPWNLVGGTSSPLPLDCDLDGDCVDWFYPHVGAFIITPGSAGIIAPHTRTAHLFAAEGSGSELELAVDMSGVGPTVDDTEPLYGMAEYTWLECGESVCPFYLGNLSAYNTTDTWDIRIEVGTVRIAKQISNVQIDLLQSTLGVQNMALSKVAFAPGALRLRVELTIDCDSCNTAGNGTFVSVIENEDYVFADYDDGALKLEHELAIQSSGTATLTIEVIPGEFPPVAVHDLDATEACDDPEGLVLDASRSFSTDPDDDVEFEIWWVDDEPLGHGSVIPVGTHYVSLEARDSRGAVHRGADQQVVVVTSGPCA